MENGKRKPYRSPQIIDLRATLSSLRSLLRLSKDYRDEISRAHLPVSGRSA